MKLPYKPTNVFHRHGGKIAEVTRIKIQKERPSGGYSRDAWYFIGAVKWSDGSGSCDSHPIDPQCLCYEDEIGRAEVDALLGVMHSHLLEHGEWRESKPQGWYATRKAKPG
jgi:hypothetical protein